MLNIAGECLYNTEEQLFKKVKEFCIHPSSARKAGVRDMVRVIMQLLLLLEYFFDNAFKCIIMYQYFLNVCDLDSIADINSKI